MADNIVQFPRHDAGHLDPLRQKIIAAVDRALAAEGWSGRYLELARIAGWLDAPEIIDTGILDDLRREFGRGWWPEDPAM